MTIDWRGLLLDQAISKTNYVVKGFYINYCRIEYLNLSQMNALLGFFL